MSNISTEKIISLLEQQKVINDYLIEHIDSSETLDKTQKLKDALIKINKEFKIVLDGAEKDVGVILDNDGKIPEVTQKEELGEPTIDLEAPANAKHDVVNLWVEEGVNEEKVAEQSQSLQKSNEATNMLFEAREDPYSNSARIETNKFKSLAKSSLFINPLSIMKKKQYNSLLQKEHSDTLDILGFEVHELEDNYNKINYISAETVRYNISQELESFKFRELNGKLTNEFLFNIADENKLKTIYTILWPSLYEKIKDFVTVTDIVSELVSTNKYLSILNNFAIKNKLTPEEVTNILVVDANACDNIFKNKKNIKSIKNNYKEIMTNVEKYSVFMRNNHEVLSVLINYVENIKNIVLELDINEERKTNLINSINDSLLLKVKEKEIFYKTLKGSIKELEVELKEENSLDVVKETISENMPEIIMEVEKSKEDVTDKELLEAEINKEPKINGLMKRRLNK